MYKDEETKKTYDVVVLVVSYPALVERTRTPSSSRDHRDDAGSSVMASEGNY